MNSLYKNHVLAKQNHSSRQSHRVATSTQHVHFLSLLCAISGLQHVRSQGAEEMCLSLEHQKPSKTSEKVGYFDRVTVSLHIL